MKPILGVAAILSIFVTVIFSFGSCSEENTLQEVLWKLIDYIVSTFFVLKFMLVCWTKTEKGVRKTIHDIVILLSWPWLETLNLTGHDEKLSLGRNNHPRQMLPLKIEDWLPSHFHFCCDDLQLNRKYDPEDKNHIVRILDYFMHHQHLCIAFEMLGNNL